MGRPITSPTLTAAGAGASSPLFFLQIAWDGFWTRLCTYGDQTWNSLAWIGGGFAIQGFGQDNKPSRIVLSDPQAAYRTLVLSQGIRDRQVSLWKGYIGALGVSDPALLFQGFADGVEIDTGKVATVSFSVDWQASSRQFSPRERIGPSIGVHFTATPNTTVKWGDTVIRIDARRGS